MFFDSVRKKQGRNIKNVNPGIKPRRTKETNKEKGRRNGKADEMTEEKRACTK